MCIKQFVLGMLVAGGLVVAPSKAANDYVALTEVMLPIVADTASNKSEIYLRSIAYHAPTTIAVTYVGGRGTASPGSMDCGTITVPQRTTVKKSLKELCPAIASGSNFGSMFLKTVGMQDGVLPRIRVFARVQNVMGLGYGVEGTTPFLTAMNNPVIALRSGVDSAGVRYQTNCFLGVRAAPHATDFTALLVMRDENGQSVGSSVPVPFKGKDGELVRVLDIFSAAGLADTYRDGYTVELFNGAPRWAYLFCTVQNNLNYSSDLRLAGNDGEYYNAYGGDLNINNSVGISVVSLTGSQTARFIGYATSQGALQCFMGDDRFHLRVRGFESQINALPESHITPRLDYADASFYPGYLDVEVSLKQGVTAAEGSLSCNSGNGIYGMLRLY